MSGVRERGEAVVGEHVARATRDLQWGLQRALRVLMDHYRDTYGKDPAYLVTVVRSGPQMLDVDEVGEAVLRDGKVKWVRECQLGHLATMAVSLVACESKPNGFGEPFTEHPYLVGLDLEPTERVVTADMDFRMVEVESFTRRSLDFAEWWTEAHTRREAKHKLTSIDFPRERLIGFGDHNTAETLQCGLVDIKRGMYQAEQGKIDVPKPETLRETLSTPKGRKALFTTVP